MSGHNSVGVLPILNYGTEEQKQRYVRDLASGKKLTAFALTEPQGGSDAAAIRTRAVRSRSARRKRSIAMRKWWAGRTETEGSLEGAPRRSLGEGGSPGFSQEPERLREPGVGSCRRSSTPDPRDANRDRVSNRVPRGTGDPMPGVSPPALAPSPRTRGTHMESRSTAAPHRYLSPRERMPRTARQVRGSRRIARGEVAARKRKGVA